MRGKLADLMERITGFVSVVSFVMLNALVIEVPFLASCLVGQILDLEALILPSAFGSRARDREERRALTLPLTAFGANLAFERNLLERFLGAF